jgi:hypothetical protein
MAVRWRVNKYNWAKKKPWSSPRKEGVLPVQCTFRVHVVTFPAWNNLDEVFGGNFQNIVPGIDF